VTVDELDEARSWGPRMTSRKADQITPTKPVWVWEPWLVAGALHLLVSRQGFGKSTFAAWLTGQVTTGRPYPDDTAARDPLNVATLSLEEAADRLVARLYATGADVGRVDVLADVADEDEEGRPFRRPWRLPKDCSVLETFIRDHEIRVLIVDGLGYSITGDSHNYAVVGSALSALAGVAERTGCAVLGLTYPPKGASDPVTSAIGSTAWTAIPRIVWVMGVDPEDESEQRRVCRVGKTNYRAPENGISFTIGNDERYECGFVTGLGLSKVTAEDLMAARQSDGERSEREEVRDLLESILGAGPVDTAEVLKATRATGVSDATVKRARRDLGVISTPRKDSVTGKLLGWSLALPDHRITPPDHQITPQGQLLIEPVEPLVSTRTYTENQRSRGSTGQGRSTGDGSPPPDDSLFEGDDW
jgi:hypothetical protein